MGGFFEMLWSKLLDLLDVAREFFGNLLQDFKESNRFFKVKAGLIVGYCAVGLFTFVVFIPPGELNQIDARVRMSKTEIVGGHYFAVENQGSDAWKNIVLRINDGFEIRWPALRPGKKKVFFFNKFRDAAGRAPSEDMVVRKLRLDCSEGVFERDFLKNR